MRTVVTTSRGAAIDVPYPVLQSIENGAILFVLLDPDAYVEGAEYREKRRAGAEPVKNLRAFSIDGRPLWEAEMPEQMDYFYKIVSAKPLIANSFSSYRCTIDAETGCITAKEFFK